MSRVLVIGCGGVASAASNSEMLSRQMRSSQNFVSQAVQRKNVIYLQKS